MALVLMAVKKAQLNMIGERYEIRSSRAERTVPSEQNIKIPATLKSSEGFRLTE